MPGHPLALMLPTLLAGTARHVRGIGPMFEVVAAGWPSESTACGCLRGAGHRPRHRADFDTRCDCTVFDIERSAPRSRAHSLSRSRRTRPKEAGSTYKDPAVGRESPPPALWARVLRADPVGRLLQLARGDRPDVLDIAAGRVRRTGPSGAEGHTPLCPWRLGAGAGPARPDRDPRRAGGFARAGARPDPVRADARLAVHLLSRCGGGDGRRPGDDAGLGDHRAGLRRRSHRQLRRLRRP